MTIDEISQLTILCKNFRETDVAAGIAERFNVSDLDTLSAGRYSASVLLTNTYLAVNSIETILSNDSDIVFFPSIIAFQGAYHNIIGNLSTLWNSINGTDLATASANLDVIIGCLITIGKWRNESRLDLSKERVLEIEDSSSKSKIALAESKETNKKIKKLQTDIEEVQTELNNFLNAKKAEFISIQNYVDQSQKDSAQIATALASVTQNNATITGLVTSSTAELASLRKSFDDTLSDIQQLARTNSESADLLKLKIAEASAQAALITELEGNIRSTWGVFKSKEEEMNKILGNVAAEGLSRTFKERSEQLENSIALWRKVSFWSLVALGVWVIGLFVSLIIWTDIDVFSWQALLATTIRSIPPALFVYFAFNQYSRERTYKEEYAFKSAVALTINSFADTMGAKVDDFRYQAILRVYKEPVFHRNKSFFNRKQIEKVYRDVFGVAKDLSSIIKK